VSEHAFGEGAIARCRTCNAVRARRGTSWIYAPPAGEPWSVEPTPCSMPSFASPWRDRPIVFLDLETTGLDWKTSVVTEVGLIRGRVVDGVSVIEDRLNSLVHVPAAFHAQARKTSEITGITLDMLCHAPSAQSVCAEVTDFFCRAGQDALLASFNAPFDVPFAASMFLRAGEVVPALLCSEPVLDPLVWSRKLDRYKKGGHKLMTVATRCGVVEEHELSGAHRADFDAEVGMRVLGALCRDVPGDINELMHWQRVARAEWEANFFAYLMKYKSGQVGPSNKVE
jgi:DNA polymerase III alpha subunit (gram-positive type)